MKKTFLFTHANGAEEIVEYDAEMFAEEDVRTIYKNLDKFYFGSACGKEIMKAAKHENN